MVQNDKKFCPSCFISQKPYIIWLSFMVHLCKIIISPSAFFIFSKFWSSGLLGGKRGKNSPKWQKILSVTPDISQAIHHMIVIYGTHMENDDISMFFLFFQNFIFWVVMGVKGQKNGPKWQEILSVTCFISQEPYIIWFSLMKRMYKMIISLGIFFFFSNFDFSGY